MPRIRPDCASVICSSNSEWRTMAAAPASSSRRTPSRCALSGEAPAIKGWRRRSPIYDVERSTDEVVGDSADGILHLDDRVGVASGNGNADMRGAVDQPLQSGVHIIERVR